AVAALLLLPTGATQVARQPLSLPPLLWILLVFAIVGPLFLTNLLWYGAIGKVGPTRATLFANLEPFLAVIFAVVLLSEHLRLLAIVGGILIFAGILVERRAFSWTPSVRRR